MSRPILFVGACLFLILAGVALYRLMFWFPITIGGAHVGQTTSFFAFIVSTALALILFRSARAQH